MEIFSSDAGTLDCPEKEVLRYMGIPPAKLEAAQGEAAGILARRATGEVQKSAAPKAVWHAFPLSLNDGEVSFAGVSIASRDLYRFLTCRGRHESIALIAATLGPRVDALIRRAGQEDAAFACALQGAGAAMIEAFVDKTQRHICDVLSIPQATWRYSPGYGDVPLEVQKVFFRLLDTRRIALTLMDTLVMAPEKSVTAFMGV